jgi:hypothetical protein
MRQKMTFADLKALYMPPPVHYKSPDGLYDKTDRTNWGSKKRARHSHQPVWLPGVPSVCPSEYRRRHLATQ